MEGPLFLLEWHNRTDVPGPPINPWWPHTGFTGSISNTFGIAYLIWIRCKIPTTRQYTQWLTTAYAVAVVLVVQLHTNEYKWADYYKTTAWLKTLSYWCHLMVCFSIQIPVPFTHNTHTSTAVESIMQGTNCSSGGGQCLAWGHQEQGICLARG